MTNRDPNPGPDPDQVMRAMRAIQYVLFVIIIISTALLVMTEPPVGWVP